MGARGRNAMGPRRGVHKNRLLPHAYRVDIVEFSDGYYDLCLGDESSRGRFWPDPLCDERRAAWEEWKDRIRGRFPFGWSNGNRPDAWVDFDLPPLLEAAVASGRFSQKAIDKMELAERIYHFDTDAAEREQIEKHWQGSVELFGPERAQEIYGIPDWFVRQASAAATPLRRRARR